jgi:pimeloyl-ACP methyl ester carboxylesterase
LVDTLGVPRLHIIAHSFGGLVALNFTLRFPERVISLALADSQIYSARKRSKHWIHANKIQAALDRFGIDLDLSDPFFGYRVLNEIARRQVGSGIDLTDLREFAPAFLGRTGIRVARQWVKLLENTDAEKELFSNDGLTNIKLRQVRCPVLALYGEWSQALDSGRLIAKLIPQASLEIVPRGGHFFPLSNPQTLVGAWLGFRSRATGANGDITGGKIHEQNNSK